MTKTFKVKVNGGPELAVDATEGTLLETLEKHQLEMHYHCRSGFCGACRTKLNSGQVRYTTEPLAYVRKGDILPCCCVPESDLDIEH
ncbi:class I ribonucleotide reductase maintenance protein YfaE [Idiomarina piscisalsi]|uniref:class I ribonucleotide reductase maintenance protein YfaE n=1 Tax=Idiomarina piscisalsi TaxID=1096243 RepID=UPI00138218D6|nr:class I ribonucleotide reductase maintenance protein YfaE [Idiomarina piscisalsi]MTJ01156.1 2Fe-2S ferredoxin-like protein [Idiomarina piscisalsi]